MGSLVVGERIAVGAVAGAVTEPMGAGWSTVGDSDEMGLRAMRRRTAGYGRQRDVLAGWLRPRGLGDWRIFRNLHRGSLACWLGCGFASTGDWL